MDTNPYQTPANATTDEGVPLAPPRRLPAILQTRTRRVAILILLLPLLVALPVQYWAFHVAGGWFVSTDIDPEQRRIHVVQMYLLLMFAIVGETVFPGLLLLFINNYRRLLTGLLLIPALLAFLLALVIFATMISAIWQFG